jgi:N-methylhydantoinase B
VESYEAKNPLLYVFRRQREDSGGHGKNRGGCGGEAAVILHGCKSYRLGFRGVGKYVASTSGIFGGYPADSIKNGFIFGVGEKLFNPGDLSRIKSFQDLNEFGVFEEKTPMAASVPVRDGDLYYLRWMGGGGYGDPLDRRPELVALDIEERKISPQVAEKIYGVILNPVDGSVDHDKTKARRMEMLQERKKGAILRGEQKNKPALEETNRTCNRVRIHEYLEIEKAARNHNARIRCRKCGMVLCEASTNYKESVPYKDRDPSEINHMLIKKNLMIYREYYCPGCATLLEVDPTPYGEAHIWDIQLSVF